MKIIQLIFDLIFGFLAGQDTNKHKRIAALILMGPLIVLSALYVLNQVERYQWFKNNPNSGFRNSLAPGSPEVKK